MTTVGAKIKYIYTTPVRIVCFVLRVSTGLELLIYSARLFLNVDTYKLSVAQYG